MIVQFKKKLLRVFFVWEILGFTFMYFSGSQGMYAVWCLEEDNAGLLRDISQLEREIGVLSDQVAAYKSAESFYQEKIAREQLQMARKGDVVYYRS